MKKIITVKEYSAFCVKKEGVAVNGYYPLEASAFADLEQFVLENNREGEDGTLEIMGLSAKKGVGKIISVKNYVGVIVMNDGTTIEILPKIYSSDREASLEESKLVFLKMLKAFRSSTYKSFQTASLDVCKMNVLEVFIRMFIDEVTSIVKRGIKCSYELIEENANCFKGKVKFTEQIKYNYAHREKVYISHDEFTVNRPENRLIKSTLAHLLLKTASNKNKKDIKSLLETFSSVPLSKNYDADFSSIVQDRNTASYYTALNWARVFLKGKGFTSFSGSNVSVALLFPMEQLFESYIASLVRKKLVPKGYLISIQDRKHHLFDAPEKKFLIKPDIVATKNGNVFVMDTKWKILSSNKFNYGISQADMYQMYAYQKKYGAQNVTLLYPKAENEDKLKETEFISKDGVKVQVRFVDLLNDCKIDFANLLNGEK